MYLDDLLAALKKGEARGIVSICSAHPWVLKAAMQNRNGTVLIETTCNQVNQYGGYTGMTPRDFVGFIHNIAEEVGFPKELIHLGGDHLGPSAWKHEPADLAMEKSKALIEAYVHAGFTKIHLDASMRLADDPPGSLEIETGADRAALMAGWAENSSVDASSLRYVIGTDVPLPGGVRSSEEFMPVTSVDSAAETIETTHAAFLNHHLADAWERVCAVVVQPGVEFGDDFVVPYSHDIAASLSKFIKNQNMIFEVHSTDYQTIAALSRMVQDHFGILKVGPALTNAFRESVLWLATIEEKLIPESERSNIVAILDAVMKEHPKYWQEYYDGDEAELTKKRLSSLSDRIRYYWSDERVQKALTKLIANLTGMDISTALLDIPEVDGFIRNLKNRDPITPQQLILTNIGRVLEGYDQAAGWGIRSPNEEKSQ